MRDVILYIAVSLDGYIADKTGGVDWIGGDGSDEKNPGSYSEFYKTVDTVLFGYTTYRQIVTELAKGRWDYADKDCYVITHRPIPNEKGITFTASEPEALVEQLKKREGGNIWVCGGASIAQSLQKADLIDIYHISVIPTLLGSGTRLFAETEAEQKLRLAGTGIYNGMVDLVYRRR